MTAQVIASLLLLLASVWALRRLLLRRPAELGADLRIVSRAGLNQRAGLALVSMSGRRLLVGYGDGAPVVLAEVSEDETERALSVTRDEPPPDDERPSTRLPFSLRRLARGAARTGLPAALHENSPGPKEATPCHR